MTDYRLPNAFESPQFNHAAVTSMLAANLLFEMISVFGLNRVRRK